MVPRHNGNTRQKIKRSLERREAHRIAVNWVVKYRAIGEKKSWNRAPAECLSGKGLKIIMNRPLKAGYNMEVSFSLGRKSQPLYVSCSVIWCKKHKKNKYKTGLKILKVNNLPSFLNFIGEKMLELSSI